MEKHGARKVNLYDGTYDLCDKRVDHCDMIEIYCDWKANHCNGTVNLCYVTLDHYNQQTIVKGNRTLNHCDETVLITLMEQSINMIGNRRMNHFGGTVDYYYWTIDHCEKIQYS